ncbi:Annexin A5 [Bagarius yarrelli]|uniref:Annexin n=1 Tax=Bagarius yarrelli TaxID=175774 RepID=A0A556UGM0_BAGYA|nr:Annexin A5 [Bagarius yarrelli]
MRLDLKTEETTLWNWEDLILLSGLKSTDEGSILQLLVARSNAQRQEIRAAYKTLHGKCLIKELQSELTGKFESLIVALLETPTMYDVKCLKNATQGTGTSEKQLIQILASRTCTEIQEINKVYKQEYKKSLEEDVSGDTGGAFRQLLVVLLQASRQQGVQEALVQSDAKPSPQGAGTDDETLIQIMVSRSEIDILDIRAEFRKMYPTSLYKMIKGDTSGDYNKTLLLLCGGDDA